MFQELAIEVENGKEMYFCNLPFSLKWKKSLLLQLSFSLTGTSVDILSYIWYIFIQTLSLQVIINENIALF